MCDFTFIPVKVSRGRKFRGVGFIIKGGYTYERGYRNSGVDPYQATDYAKLWDPSSKRCVYANAEFCEDVEMPEAEVNAHRKAYIDNTVNGTIDWCRSQKPNGTENEILSFARNVLRKHHPELMDEINMKCPDTRDPAAEVEKTIKWALTLRTKPCVIYGKHCPGGKIYSDERYVDIAYKALEKRGITKLAGFREAWDLYITLAGLPNKNIG